MSTRLQRLAWGLVVAWAAMPWFSSAHAQCSADPWADSVAASSFSVGDPAAVLGAPDGVLADFEESGANPGFVIVAFDGDTIVDGPGDDFIIHVFDFPITESVEAFEVDVSSDGSLFVPLTSVFPTMALGDLPEALGFDLAGSGVTAVTHVRITGMTVDVFGQGEGVDLDAFEALNCSAEPDTCPDDLDLCTIDLGICEVDLEVCHGGLDECDGDLAEARRSIAEGLEGLAEIRRLLGLPPGQRDSDFACTGDLCDAVQEAIEMLTGPPGQNVRRGKPPARR